MSGVRRCPCGGRLQERGCVGSRRSSGARNADLFSLVAVLIGTGIGVTPFASILKNIWCVLPLLLAARN